MITRRDLVTGASATGALLALQTPAWSRTPTIYLTWRGAGSDQGIYFVQTGDPPNFPAPDKANPFGTATRPSILRLGGHDEGKLLMTWRGIEGDTGMWWSLFDGINWANQQNIPGIGSTWGPSLALRSEGAYMAWNGANGDTRVWGCVYDPTQAKPWGPQQPLGMKSGSGPALLALHDILLMVWRGEGDNDNLYSAVSTDFKNWSKPLPIPNAASTDVPALTFFKGEAFLAFKGGRNDTGLYASRFTPQAGNANGGTWQQRWAIPNVGSSSGPSIGVWATALFMAWRGTKDDDVWYSRSATGDMHDWRPQASIGGAGTLVGPAVTLF